MAAVVMIDQDGVMCDRSYQPTFDVREACVSLRQAGYRLVSNSDTPYPRLWQNTFAMLGVEPDGVVVENGAGVFLPPHRYTALRPSCQVQPFRNEIVACLSGIADQVLLGDAPTWRRQGRRFPEHLNAHLVLMDDQRRHSVGFYVLSTDQNGFPGLDESWGNIVLQALNDLSLPTWLKEPDYNPAYGITIIGDREADKTNGFRLLHRLIGTERYYMIGDSLNDWIQDERVVTCAVGNASPELKRAAGFVASRSYTEGLAECLEWITTQT